MESLGTEGQVGARSCTRACVEVDRDQPRVAAREGTARHMPQPIVTLHLDVGDTASSCHDEVGGQCRDEVVVQAVQYVS